MESLLRALFCLKVLLQPGKSHDRGFSPLWMRRCCSRACLADNSSSQISHTNGLSGRHKSVSAITHVRDAGKKLAGDLQSVWVRICRSILLLFLNASLRPSSRGQPCQPQRKPVGLLMRVCVCAEMIWSIRSLPLKNMLPQTGDPIVSRHKHRFWGPERSAIGLVVAD